MSLQAGDNDPRIGAEVWVPSKDVSAKITAVDGDTFTVSTPDGEQFEVQASEVEQHPEQE